MENLNVQDLNLSELHEITGGSITLALTSSLWEETNTMAQGIADAVVGYVAIIDYFVWN